MLTTSKFLKNAKLWIEDEIHFSRTALARDINGNIVYGVSKPEAYSFCSIGAVLRESKATPDSNKLYYQALNYLGRAFSQYKGEALVSFGVITEQDKMSHADVMSTWNAAIEAAERDESNE